MNRRCVGDVSWRVSPFSPNGPSVYGALSDPFCFLSRESFCAQHVFVYKNDKIFFVKKKKRSSSPPLVVRLFSQACWAGQTPFVRERAVRNENERLLACGRVIESTTSSPATFFFLFPSAPNVHIPSTSSRSQTTPSGRSLQN